MKGKAVSKDPVKSSSPIQLLLFRAFTSRLTTLRLALPLIIAALVGTVTGITIVGFIKLIGASQSIFFIHFQGLFKFAGKYAVILVPAAGGLLVGLLITFLAPEAKGHGVPEVLKSIAFRGGRMNFVSVIVKAAASIISIGSGSSVGREGPAVHIGSGLGSMIARTFKLSESRIKNLVACGAAAGISSVFNAPITGVMFALEIMLKDFGARALSTVVVSSVAASIVSRIFLGESPAFVVPLYRLWSPFEIFLYLILGIFSALTALIFIKGLDKIDLFFEKLKTPEWSKPALGGLIVGGIGIYFPQVFGMGFVTIEAALHGSLEINLILMLIFLKVIATSVSLGSGSSGGTFAPTLFVGAVLGEFFGKLFYQNFPFSVAPPGAYALVGMASVFAGAFHAPVTAILLVFEMTGDYHMILPIMVAAVVATSLSQILSRESIDTIKLKRQGIDIESFEEAKIFSAIQVRDAMSDDFLLVPRNMPVKELAEKIGKEKNKSLFVVNSSGQLTGMIVPERIQEVILEKDLTLFVADDLSVPCPEVCYPHDSLIETSHFMLSHQLTQLPVLNPDAQDKVAGVLKSENIFRTYTEMSVKRSDLMGRLEQEGTSASGTIRIHFHIPKNSDLIGKEIKNIKIPNGVILTSIQRRNKTLVPEGDTVIRSKDEIWAVIIPEKETEFREWLEKNHLAIHSFFG